MSDDHSRNQQRSEAVTKLANNTFLLLMARGMMAIGFPVAMSVLGFGINWMVESTRANTDAITRMERDSLLITAELKAGLKVMQDNVVPHVIAILSNRLDGHADRLNKLEVKVDLNDKAARDRDAAQTDELKRLLEKMYEGGRPAPPAQGR